VTFTKKEGNDLAKDLVNLHDTTARQGKVAELQRQILDAQLTGLHPVWMTPT
jgi:hypothetical protein